MLEVETCKFIHQKLKHQQRNPDNYQQVAKEFPIVTPETTLSADYALLDTDGNVIAIIEAKNFSRSARDGEFQALEYAEHIEDKQGYRPFIFLSNGRELYFYHSAANQAPRKVKTFFTLSDLHRLKALHTTAFPSTSQQVDANIAGRDYQIEAIKSVVEKLEQGKRKFLLVMATGTGKTRTAMGLIDVLLKTHTIQKVLFLTDRTALRNQAFDDGFKPFFPEEPKTKILTKNVDTSARLYSATYQTIINLLDQFSSGFFDLIIMDEVHRSIYREWKTILDYFDCYQVGLTATPIEFVERNTYQAFDCKDQGPTYDFGLDEAIKQHYLVPYRVLLARTAKQIQGIKDRELPANIKSQLGKEGKFPEDYHFEGSDIGKRIDNKDTNRAMIREFMEQAYKIEDGLPGKSIIFAMNQTHAEHLQETFEELYPHLHHFSVVITSNVERADQLLQTFKKYTTEKKFRVAISVDMLDTGIDIPALLNLVFAKKVLSQAKFRQMIGRGTRLCPNVYGKGQNKSDFLIIDYCLNFDESHQFKAPNKQPLPLQQQYFELQIKLLKLREHRKKHKYYETTKKLLLAMVNSLVATDERRMNDEILQRYPLIQSILQGQIFNTIALNPYEQLQKIAPLMRYYDKYTAEELRFLIKNEQYLLASLKGEDTTKRRDKIASDINALSPTISKVQEKSGLIREVLSPAFWEKVNVEKLNQLKKEFTSLMKYKDLQKPGILLTDLEDKIIVRRWIEYAEGKKMESDKYRSAFVQELNEQVQSSPALQNILNNQVVERKDIRDLEQLLEKSDYRFSTSLLRKVIQSPTADFEQLIRVALGKGNLPGWEQEVQELFEQYIQQKNFSAVQIRFLQIVKSLIIQKKKVDYEMLYSPVFESVFGVGAFERLFKEEEAERLMEFLEGFGLE